MSENFKEDLKILQKANQDYEAVKTNSAIQQEVFQKLVQKCVKDLEKKGHKEKDLDLFL